MAAFVAISPSEIAFGDLRGLGTNAFKTRSKEVNLIMASKSLLALDAATPVTDNFQLIRGIGPSTEGRLHDAGILSFTQLGTMSPSAIYTLVRGVPGMSVGRIAEQGWSDRARELASEPPPAESHSNATHSGDRQHYATFTIKLLLDEDNNVRRTRVTHIQSDNEALWPGWDEHRMIKFIVHHAALHLPPLEPLPQSESPDRSTLDLLSSKPSPQPEPPDRPTLKIIKATTQEVGSIVPSNVINSNQAWSIHTEWELSSVTMDMLTGHWLVQAHLEPIGPGQKYSLPVSRGAKVPLSDFAEPEETIYTYQYKHDINIAASTVAAGTYKLVVAIIWAKEVGGSGGLANFFEGTLLQLYA